MFLIVGMSIGPEALGRIDIKATSAGILILLSQEAGEGADSKNDTARDQRVFRDFNRGRDCQFFPPLLTDRSHFL